MAKAPKFLTARRIHLAMLNYEVDPSILRKLLPTGTDLDTFDGKTFVSMVGFQFLDTRVLGIPVPFHRNFDEVNLRFYVRRNAEDGPRLASCSSRRSSRVPPSPGVGRQLYNENYLALRMSHEDQVGQNSEPRVTYQWEYGRHLYRLAVRVAGSPYLPDKASEESFNTEHYWGYVRRHAGTTLEYQVEHARWKVWRVRSRIRC